VADLSEFTRIPKAKPRHPYASFIEKYSDENGIDPELTYRVAGRENKAADPNATSWAGAQGLMQLEPGTARRFGVTNPSDPEQNIMGGTKYLRYLLDRYHGDIAKAVAGYNAGEGAVDKYGLNRVRSFSNFPQGDPRRGGYEGSTGQYVDRITSGYDGFGYHPKLIKRQAMVRPLNTPQATPLQQSDGVDLSEFSINQPSVKQTGGIDLSEFAQSSPDDLSSLAQPKAPAQQAAPAFNERQFQRFRRRMSAGDDTPELRAFYVQYAAGNPEAKKAIDAHLKNIRQAEANYRNTQIANQRVAEMMAVASGGDPIGNMLRLKGAPVWPKFVPPSMGIIRAQDEQGVKNIDELMKQFHQKATQEIMSPKPAGYEDYAVARRLNNPEQLESDINERANQLYVDYINNQVPAADRAELEQSLKIDATKPAYQRVAGRASGAFAGSSAKAAAGLTQLVPGMDATRLTDYLNRRGNILNAEATHEPLDAQGKEIRRSIPEKVTTAIYGLGLDVAKLVLLRKATGLSLPTILATETALQSNDRPFVERALMTGQAYLMGKVLESRLPQLAQGVAFAAPRLAQGLASGEKTEDLIIGTGTQGIFGMLMGNRGEAERAGVEAKSELSIRPGEAFKVGNDEYTYHGYTPEGEVIFQKGNEQSSVSPEGFQKWTGLKPADAPSPSSSPEPVRAKSPAEASPSFESIAADLEAGLKGEQPHHSNFQPRDEGGSFVEGKPDPLAEFARPTEEARAEAESQIVQKLKAAEEAARERLKAKLSPNRLSAGLDPTAIADLAIIGASKLARKGIDVAVWSKEMIDEFGEQVRPHLKKIYGEAKGIYDGHRASFRPGDARQIVEPSEGFNVSNSSARTPKLEVASAAYKVGLLGVKTHIRNVASTGINQAFEEVSRVPAAVTDLIISVANNRRSVAAPDVMAVARASRAAATEGINDALQIMKSGATAEQLTKSQMGREVNSGSKIIDAYLNGNFRLLAAEDQVFRVYAMRRSLAEQAKVWATNEARNGRIERSLIPERARELEENPTPEMQAQAVADAEILTFNNNHILHQAYQGAREKIGKVFGGKVANFGLDVVLPFTRTPLNVLTRSLEATPLGAGVAAVRMARAVLRGAFTEAEQRKFSITMGRSATGTALILLGYQLASRGLLTGTQVEGEFAQNEKNKTVGRRPGAILNPRTNTWHKISDFSPMGNLLVTGATLFEGRSLPTKENNYQQDITADSVGRAATGLALDQPFMSTTKDIAAAAIEPGKRGPKLLGRLAGGFVPTHVSDAAALIDDKERSRGNDFINQIKARVPLWRESLPEDVDAFGRPVEHRRTDVIDPTLTRTALERTNAVEGELARFNVGLGTAKRGKDESRDEFRQRRRDEGKIVYDVIAQFIQTPQYKALRSRQKRYQLSLVIKETRAELAGDRSDQ
jgi:hypothetical protein